MEARTLSYVKNHKMGYYKVATRLLGNSLKFRVCKIINRPLKPTAVSLAVTNRCNSRCIMCNIWKNAGDNPGIKNLELSSQKIISIFDNRLFSELVELDLTGGEPHLRDDLADIVPGIARLKKRCLPRLRSIIITSNGYLSKTIISNYRAILETTQDMNIDLVSVISLDGIGHIHDLIRGTKNAFKLAYDTISGLSQLKQEYPGLIPGIKTTILPHNIDSLDSILSFALSKNLFHIISPAIFTEARFGNTAKEELLALRENDIEKVRDFYSRGKLKTSYFYNKGLSYLTTMKKQWLCTASYNYLFIDFNGKVYPCEIMPEAIGDVTHQDIFDIWTGTEARERRKKIRETERCKTCHEPGAIRYSAVTEGACYRKFLSGLGKHAYEKSLEGEGYDKYLNI